MRLSQLHPNDGQIEGVPRNPRQITEEEFAKLKKSLKKFHKMLALRPIVVDEGMNILGGNMRYQALKKLADEGAVCQVFDIRGALVSYFKFEDEIPDDWVKVATDLTPDEKMEFIIKDNEECGEWDYDLLANEWDAEKLREWDIEAANWDADVNTEEEKEEQPEVKFAEVLNEANNYIVLQFKNEVDWLQAVTLLGVERCMLGSTRQDGKITKSRRKFGTARVLDGAVVLNKFIKE